MKKWIRNWLIKLLGDDIIVVQPRQLSFNDGDVVIIQLDVGHLPKVKAEAEKYMQDVKIYMSNIFTKNKILILPSSVNIDIIKRI